MVTRQAPRVTVQGPAVFLGGPVAGQGTVVNLSSAGCALETTIVLTAGNYLALTLGVPDQDSPLVVNLAAVRWAVGKKAGLEFIRLGPDEQQRLQQFTRVDRV